MPSLQPFFLALRFLTRVPAPVNAQSFSDQALQGRAVLFYPLVGVVIGLLLAGLTNLLGDSSALLQAALLLTFWVWLTGALHLDGLADLADAWVGGYGSAERTLEIMKDSRSGPIAVVTLVLLLLVKFTALTVLIEQGSWPLLLLAPLLGRTALVALFLSLPYLRTDGMGRSQTDYLPHQPAKLVVVASGVVSLLLAGWSAIGLLLLVAVLFLLFRRALLERIGGFTGDVAGAICELTEAVTLVALALSL
ncbi:MAG: adenosylcobinamide-GDP ribazoletransferase [Chromatiales bacterium]|nr:adenosylcobinamide-GDP ribazoletransferase [Chromatiales bacterium]